MILERAKLDIVVIGASAGGLQAVSTVLSQFPRDLPAAVMVVLHVSAQAGSEYAGTFARASTLPVRIARNEDTIYHGNVYVARPDHHLLVMPEHLRVVRGPKENRSRPAVDPLFRSAAVNYGARVVGVLMTGMLDDGVAGLGDIQAAGGVTIIQDPSDAAAASMPQHALERVAIDHVEPAHRIGALIARLVNHPPVPDEEIEMADRRIRGLEVEIAAGADISLDRQEKLGDPAGLGCPECGGPLVTVADPTTQRFRCHIGHAYTATALLADQGEQVERALSAAMRTLEERGRLLADLARASRDDVSADDLWHRSDEARKHADTLRTLVLRGAGEEQTAPSPTPSG